MPTLTTRLEKALRLASLWHRGQRRKQSDLPYIQHPFAVALILDRLGFEEDVVIAGLLHDAVEDTEATIEMIREEFGERVADLVASSTEEKRDAEGRKRPWEDRKRDHLESLAKASVDARAVVLADKLHNLLSMRFDVEAGQDLWERFNAPRDRVLWYYESMIVKTGYGDPRLKTLAGECRDALDTIRGSEASGIETPGGLTGKGKPRS